MKFTHSGEEVKIIKPLNIKDKEGIWYQIEYLTGPDKNMRKPIAIAEDKVKKLKI